MKEKFNINSSLNGLATHRENRTAIIINGSFTYILIYNYTTDKCIIEIVYGRLDAYFLQLNIQTSIRSYIFRIIPYPVSDKNSLQNG